MPTAPRTAMFFVCFLKLLLLLTFVIEAVHGKEEAGQKQSGNKRKPNFLVIHLDDVGYGDLSFYSLNISKKLFRGRLSYSPQIDRMATEGTAFTSYYASACVCTPSRAGILTGRYPIRTSVFPGVLGPSDDRGLPDDEITIAEWLKEKAGYDTFLVGKWHLGHVEPYLPTFHGFDKWVGMPYSHDMCPCPSTLTNTEDNRCHTWDPPCPLMNHTTVIQQPVILNDIIDYYVEKTIEFMGDAVRANKPFFGYYGCQHTHHPQFAKTSNLGKSKALGGRPDAYGDAVWEMDDAVGRILDYLRDNNLQDNTYVFLASDNGAAPIYYYLSGMNSPYRCGKGTTWEGGQRVPFIVWGGKTLKGKVQNDMVAGMDLFPTISHLAGVSTENIPKVLDGIDFSEIMTGVAPLVPVKKKRDSFFYYGLSGSLDAVRMGKYKVHFKTSIWVHEKVMECHPPKVRVGPHFIPVIYDLEADLGEHEPLARRTPLHNQLSKAAHDLVKQHECTIAKVRSSCDASYSTHCFTLAQTSQLLPPTPFAPYSMKKRACCSWGFDIVLPDWTNVYNFSCVKMNGRRHACFHEYNLLCNPATYIHPQCGTRAVCAKASNDSTMIDHNVICANETSPTQCPQAYSIKYCARGLFQCRGVSANNGAICVSKYEFCENYGGVAYVGRGCTDCHKIPNPLPGVAHLFEQLHLIQPFDGPAAGLPEGVPEQVTSVGQDGDEVEGGSEVEGGGGVEGEDEDISSGEDEEDPLISEAEELPEEDLPVLQNPGASGILFIVGLTAFATLCSMALFIPFRRWAKESAAKPVYQKLPTDANGFVTDENGIKQMH